MQVLAVERHLASARKYRRACGANRNGCVPHRRQHLTQFALTDLAGGPISAGRVVQEATKVSSRCGLHRHRRIEHGESDAACLGVPQIATGDRKDTRGFRRDFGNETPASFRLLVVRLFTQGSPRTSSAKRGLLPVDRSALSQSCRKFSINGSRRIKTTPRRLSWNFYHARVTECLPRTIGVSSPRVHFISRWMRKGKASKMQHVCSTPRPRQKTTMGLS